MPLEFDIQLTGKDMYKFNMYQTYHSSSGWLSFAVAILAFALSYRNAASENPESGYTLLYALFGVVFLIYMPLSLLLKSKNAVVSSPVLSKALHYSVDDSGIKVSQEGEESLLEWKQVYKILATKSNVLVYSNRTNAYIIPREQLGENYGRLQEIANRNLEKYRGKI